MQESGSEVSRVGVAMCTFNSERYLGRQIASIEDQSHAVDEWIIADDGSTDGTPALLQNLKTRNSAVRLLNGDVGVGVTANFERALAASSCPIIALSDHDDLWLPSKVDSLVRHLTGKDLAMAFSDAELIDSEDQAIGRSLFDSLRVSATDRQLIAQGEAIQVLVRRNVVTGATSAVTKDLVDLARPFPHTWIHDEWLAAVASLVGTLIVMEEPQTRYRIHGWNLIGVASPRLRARARRMLASLPGRFEKSAERFSVLLDKAIAIGAPEEAVDLIRRKVAFETSRVGYSKSRALRLRPILRLALRGDYATLSSQGNADILRDLLVR